MEIKYNKKYNYNEVKDLVRQKQIYILDTIVNICNNHHLVYWLDGGTLLGAVRHQGFIPWDDDIDIGFMRDDYIKLIKILTNKLPEDLKLQSRYTDSSYKIPYIKIRDKYSKIMNHYDDYKYQGIFIDIFPFDMMPKSNILKKVQKTLFILLEVMMVHTDINKLNISKKKDFKSLIIKTTMKSLSLIGSFFNNKIFDLLYNSIKNISKLSPSDEIGDGLTSSWAYYKSIRKKEDYIVSKTGEFCGKKYNVPNNYDKYLTTLYGKNYMTPINSDNVHIDNVVFYSKDDKTL